VSEIIDVSSDLTNESDEKILQTIQEWEDEVKEIESELAETRRWIAEFQQVLDRRALERM
jgi:peptidoglycan hydrolase CwlO-like protein